MTFEQASGISTTYGTSYHALKQRADLQPGENLARAWARRAALDSPRWNSARRWARG